MPQRQPGAGIGVSAGAMTASLAYCAASMLCTGPPDGQQNRHGRPRNCKLTGLVARVLRYLCQRFNFYSDQGAGGAACSKVAGPGPGDGLRATVPGGAAASTSASSSSSATPTGSTLSRGTTVQHGRVRLGCCDAIDDPGPRHDPGAQHANLLILCQWNPLRGGCANAYPIRRCGRNTVRANSS